MGIKTFNDTINSPVPAQKLFKGFITDAQNVIQKAVPHTVKNIHLIKGDGGPGSIVQIDFAESVPIKYVKHRVDVLDKDSLTYVETVIEGGDLTDKITSVIHEYKFETSSDGGCKVNMTAKIHLKEGSELNEEEVKPAKEGILAVLKGVEAYLLANPNYA